MNLLKIFQNFTKEISKPIEISGRMVYAYYLPKEWNEKKIKQVLGVEEVTLVRDRLSRATGKALLKVKNEQEAQKLIEKYEVNMLDDPDVLQRIVLKPFNLKKQSDKLEIERNQKQAYITGLPRELKTEELLDMVIDFGEIVKVQLPKENDNRNRGYGFVLFKNAKDALKFRDFMNGKEFMGKRLGYEQILINLLVYKFDSQKEQYDRKSDRVIEDKDQNLEENQETYDKLMKILK